jgi:hypothetical protein
MKTEIRSKNKYPIFQLIGYAWILFMGLSDFIGFDHPWITTGAVILELVIVYLSLISVDVIVTENEIVKGDKYLFFPKLQSQKFISRSNFGGLTISQNRKKYFDILAIGKDGTDILIDSIPNRNPANEKLAELEEKIAKAW